MSAEVVPSGFIAIGTAVSLVCDAVMGDLPIFYSWTGPDGQNVSFANTNGTVLVMPTTSGHYGIYTCTAQNEFGMAATTVEVLQASMCIMCDNHRMKGLVVNF